MKKLLILVLICFLAMPMVVLADGNGVQNQNQIQENTTNETLETPELIMTPEPKTLREKVQAKVQEHKEIIDEKIEEMPTAKKLAYQNQNTVREAVQALHQLGNFQNGTMGERISSIARNFNNSVKMTLQAEEKIQKRSGLLKWLIGGDLEAADEMETELDQIKTRIQEMKQVRNECDTDCTELIQEQEQVMEQERSRLQELVNSERAQKGIFGWLFK